MGVNDLKHILRRLLSWHCRGGFIGLPFREFTKEEAKAHMEMLKSQSRVIRRRYVFHEADDL